jgi:hypothetical protein
MHGEAQESAHDHYPRYKYCAKSVRMLVLDEKTGN